MECCIVNYSISLTLVFLFPTTGNTYVNEFCMCTVNSVASPFVLYDIVIEAAQYLTQSSAIQAPLRSHLLTPLIQKCQQM